MILLRVARFGGQVRSAVALASLGGQVEEIKRLERPSRIRFGASSALLEYAVMHRDEAEAEPPTPRLRRPSRLRAALRKLTDEVKLARGV